MPRISNESATKRHIHQCILLAQASMYRSISASDGRYRCCTRTFNVAHWRKSVKKRHYQCHCFCFVPAAQLSGWCPIPPRVLISGGTNMPTHYDHASVVSNTTPQKIRPSWTSPNTYEPLRPHGGCSEIPFPRVHCSHWIAAEIQ